MENKILIHFFYGEDTFRIIKEIEKIKSGILKKEEIDFNFDKLTSPIPVEFLNIASSYPVFAKRRVLQIEDFDESFLNNKSLQVYCKSPSETTVVIFYFNGRKINENSKFFKELKNKNYFKLHKVRFLYDNELPSYIKNLSKEKGIKLSDETIHYITRYTGNSTLNINSELDKITSGVNACGNSATEISLDEVKPIIALSKRFNIFDLIDKILDRNLRAAFSIFNIIYSDGEEPIKIISMLYSEIRKLHRAKIQERSGMDFETVLNVNSIRPFLKRRFIKNLSSFSIQELKKITKLLEDADFKLKTASIPQDLVFEEFIFKISCFL
ncbi:DNA polymerase III subunit delta [Candidatus Acidulodesulfobacterium sp. H_13]|uniref:DNA polymerase III subunit delta n=1 Tax=Candidatus Acidulodesulfobacterium sp. H_13 TaxID=3395470 RepID=UPI003AF68412